MRLDVLFGVAALSPGDVAGRVVAVIDVLRASSTIATALANGARSIVPLESSEEVILRSKQFARRDVKLAGERRMLPIPGFDLGNSPGEYTPEAIEGKTILFATTNGTPALLATQGARDVIVASYVNLKASLAFLRTAARGGGDVTILCAGRERHFALEDAACAGRYVYQITKRLQQADVNDAALAASLIDRKYGDNLMRLFSTAAHGRALAAAGFEGDLAACAAVDSYPVIPIFQDRQITKLGPERER